MLDLYADPAAAASGAEGLQPEELINYLHQTENLALTPLDSILAQTESIGDPALPTPEQIAILHWVGAAFDNWERDFPLEEPLASEFRRLKPLAAALAIFDPAFFELGGHPLHRIIDSLQLSAVGWQPRLGRAGQGLQKQVAVAVESALGWFDNASGKTATADAIATDLAGIASGVVTAIERDLARASRMTQRMVETEQGKIKTAEAKRKAAAMINDALRKFPAPASIGDFLKGPWYESAQLVLLKFGTESAQWQQMTTTTDTLLDSLQMAGVEDPARRQHLFEVVTQLPRELRRWLVSLQHDSEAVNDAIGLVEFAHMRILRKQELELEQVKLISIAGGDTDQPPRQAPGDASTGQWFELDTGDGKPVRARLGLRLDSAGQMLFANQAGIKVLQTSFEEFAALLADGNVAELDCGASFSRALAHAAGLKTSKDLEAFLGIAAAQARQEQAAEEQLAAERRLREREAAERSQREQEAREDRIRQQQEAERLKQEQAEAERLRLEQEEAEQLQREWDEAERIQRERRQGNTLQAEREEAQRLQQAVNLESRPGASGIPTTQAADHAEPAQQAPPLAPAQEPLGPELQMGAWLGFHDGDTPLLAKLAVHDRENDNFIFVNRSGIKMRQLSKKELLALMDKGLVDILETRSSFRDEITRARKKSTE